MKCNQTALLFLIPLALQLAAGADEREFNPRVVIPRVFRAIVEPDVVSLKKADGSLVKNEELVLGVVVGKEARAYPINTLTGPRREIINDQLGGQAIAATW
jgi:hypothetical protein